MTRDLHAELAILNTAVDENSDDLDLRRRRDTCRSALTSSAARTLYLETYPKKPRRKKTMSKSSKPQGAPPADKMPSNEEFVRAYQTSNSTPEAAAKLGVPDHTKWVGVKAGSLRRLGVRLKRMPKVKHYEPVDVSSLNAILESLEQ